MWSGSMQAEIKYYTQTGLETWSAPKKNYTYNNIFE